MKARDLGVLVQAGDVGDVVISRDWEKKGPSPWEVWAFGGEAVDSLGSLVRADGGERRLFGTLDEAYAFVRGAGFRGQVAVEDRFLPESVDAL